MMYLTIQEEHTISQNLTEVRFPVTKYNRTKISDNIEPRIN
jgi:hypothetical protein